MTPHQPGQPVLRVPADTVITQMRAQAHWLFALGVALPQVVPATPAIESRPLQANWPHSASSSVAKDNNLINIDFDKLSLTCRAHLRNRTVDLLLTMQRHG